MGQVTVHPLCYRQDLTKPALIFAGLLLTAAVFCNTADLTRPAGPLLDEVRVLNDEHAIGPNGFDPYALDCRPEKSSKGGMVRVSATHCTRRPANAPKNTVH